jgi:4-amino-4-deoxy-L-arabinose transferase-like glycosyltransferase
MSSGRATGLIAAVRMAWIDAWLPATWQSRNKGMFPGLQHRCGHYALLLAVSVLLTFPNLGSPSLWDIDEGNNAEAAREMLDCGNWVVPTFNYQLRVDKPALLYWLQISAFRLFGTNEFAARFPSALAALAATLLTYELAGGMFGSATGLLAGLVLASTGLFCASSHFANPDALLNAFTLLVFLFCWRSITRQGRAWSVVGGASAGLAVLAKGPVGLVLPCTVITLFLLWSRKFRLLWDRRLLWAALVFALVALPWYIWVGVETKVAFLRAFILQHNVGRFLHPMEHHSGPVYYYLGVVALGFAPWSAFLGLTAWYGTAGRVRNEPRHTSTEVGLLPCYRFLWCWITVYFLFFSLAGTKLPNYILPLYAPLAILTARFLDRWRTGAIQPANWALHLSVACFALIGLGTAAALLVAGGVIRLPILHGWRLAGLASWALVGTFPVLGAAAAWYSLWRRHRGGLVLSATVSSVLFIGALFACGTVAVDAHKAPRALVQAAQAQQADHDIRVGCYQYFQPSLVFYCRREVQRLESEEQVLDFLRCPLPVYLFMPATAWEKLQTRVCAPYQLLARHSDLYRQCEVVVVRNR